MADEREETRRPKPRPRQGLSPRIAKTAEVGGGAVLGADTMVGVFCLIADGAVVGDGTRIQSHTSVWAGVSLGEDVFVGPAAVFTNVRHPRAAFVRAPDWDKTVVEHGATIGAGSILVAPLRIGEFALVGAGAVVTRDVPAHAVVVGNPARVVAWACICGEIVQRSETAPADFCCERCQLGA